MGTGASETRILPGGGAASRRRIRRALRPLATRYPAGRDTRQSRQATRTAMNSRYNAADIEVLSGLDPVKRRPGMYTDTTRPEPPGAGSGRQRGRRSAGRPRRARSRSSLHADGSLRGRRRRPRHAGRHPPRGEDPGRRTDPHAAARGRKIQQQELHLLRRPARRRRQRGQRAVDARRSAHPPRRQRIPDDVRARRPHLEAGESSAPSARRTPARACASGRMRSISTRRSSTCARSSTCCAPRRCCAPA